MELEYWVLAFYPPQSEPVVAGVLVFAPNRSSVYLRVRDQWSAIVTPEDAEVLDGYAQMLVEYALDLGAEGFAQLLEESLSGSVRILHQDRLTSADVPSALDTLYKQYVE
jgi:hypothetical protein